MILIFLNLYWSFKTFLYVFFMCIDVLSSCILVHHVHAVPRKPEEGVRYPGTGVKDRRRHHVGDRNRTQVLLLSNYCS